MLRLARLGIAHHLEVMSLTDWESRYATVEIDIAIYWLEQMDS